jgi:glutamate-1-semialdehyde 2,1-aminomutase
MQITQNLTTEDIIIHQQEYLDKLIQRHCQKTQTSKKIAQKNRQILADNKTFTKFNIGFKEIFYPIVAQRSLGSKIWDIDGNEYIDVTMGFGINLFGHNPSFIQAALVKQLEKGIQLGPQTEHIGEVAELICEFTGMERVAFSNTGTEAVMTAIRLARTVTGKNKIVIFSGSYHGHFDGTLGKVKTIDKNSNTLPLTPGILPKFVEDILVLKYDNFDSLEVIKNQASEIAAVLVEPVQTQNLNLQPKEFLHQLREVTQESRIALIFDEMITGFRIHPGGAQAWFGIQADIATYGKIVGGGIPIGVIAGKADYMDAIDGGMWNYGDDSIPQTKTTFFAGTHCKHPLGIAAAKAVLEYLKNRGTNLQVQLNQRTSQFVEQLNNYFENEALPIKMVNFGSVFGSASFGDDSDDSQEKIEADLVFDLLYYHLLNRGIMLRGGGGFLSTAHTNEDIERMFLAVQDSITELREGYFLPN